MLQGLSLRLKQSTRDAHRQRPLPAILASHSARLRDARCDGGGGGLTVLPYLHRRTLLPAADDASAPGSTPSSLPDLPAAVGLPELAPLMGDEAPPPPMPSPSPPDADWVFGEPPIVAERVASLLRVADAMAAEQRPFATSVSQHKRLDVFSQHIAHWFVDFGSLPVEFRRHFPAMFELYCNDIAAAYATLRQLSFLNVVPFEGTALVARLVCGLRSSDTVFKISEEHGASLSKPCLLNITSLTFTFCGLTDDTIGFLCASCIGTFLPGAKRVDPLGLPAESDHMGESDANNESPSHHAGPSLLPALQELDVTHNKLSSKSLRWLHRLLNARGLRRLSLRGNDLSSAVTTDHPLGVTALDLVREAPRLESLDVGYCKLDASVVSGIIEYLPFVSLRELSIDGAEISAKLAVAVLQHANSNQSLQTLSCRFCGPSCTQSFHTRLEEILRHNTATRVERRQREARRKEKRRAQLAATAPVDGSSSALLRAASTLERSTAVVSVTPVEADDDDGSHGTACPAGYRAYTTNEPSLYRRP